MFVLSCAVALFFIIFFIKGSPYTIWGILFFTLVLLCRGQNFITHDLVWNFSFLCCFLVSLFLFCIMRRGLDLRLPFFVLLMSGIYFATEMFAAVYTEWVRIDLSLLCGCGLFLLTWFFERNLFQAFCLSVCTLFFSVVFFGFGQLILGKAGSVQIGSALHLNEIGWMLFLFIFFSLCERIQVIEKNYG